MSDRLKIAVLGGGSVVFAPSVLYGAFLEHRLHGIEIALVDSDEGAVFPMADVGRRIAQRGGGAGDVAVTAHTHMSPALEGASYVICAAGHDVSSRFTTDCRIIEALAPDHAISKFGGVAGISYSLRQIRMIQEICGEMKRLCVANAMLLNVSNPLPRVCQAAHEEGVYTVGFCSASLAAYGWVWRILRGEQLAYPFEPARSMLDLSTAGLNHLSFILDLWDHQSGEDLYPVLRDVASGEGRNAGQPMSAKLLVETGYFPAAGDNQIRDFLEPPADCPAPRAQVSEEDQEQREQRLKLLEGVAQGKQTYDELLARRAWERPIDLVAALAFNRPAAFTSLNLLNTRQIQQLPRKVFVETAATADGKGVCATPVQVPESLVPLLQRTAQVTDTIVRAARWTSRKHLDEAVELDPTIVDKTAGRNALDECLKAHADILPAYK